MKNEATRTKGRTEKGFRKWIHGSKKWVNIEVNISILSIKQWSDTWIYKGIPEKHLNIKKWLINQ